MNFEFLTNSYCFLDFLRTFLYKLDRNLVAKAVILTEKSSLKNTIKEMKKDKERLENQENEIRRNKKLKKKIMKS